MEHVSITVVHNAREIIFCVRHDMGMPIFIENIRRRLNLHALKVTDAAGNPIDVNAHVSAYDTLIVQ